VPSLTAESRFSCRHAAPPATPISGAQARASGRVAARASERLPPLHSARGTVLGRIATIARRSRAGGELHQLACRRARHRRAFRLLHCSHRPLCRRCRRVRLVARLCHPLRQGCTLRLRIEHRRKRHVRRHPRRRTHPPPELATCRTAAVARVCVPALPCRSPRRLALHRARNPTPPSLACAARRNALRRTTAAPRRGSCPSRPRLPAASGRTLPPNPRSSKSRELAARNSRATAHTSRCVSAAAAPEQAEQQVDDCQRGHSACAGGLLSAGDEVRPSPPPPPLRSHPLQSPPLQSPPSPRLHPPQPPHPHARRPSRPRAAPRAPPAAARGTRHTHPAGDALPRRPQWRRCKPPRAMRRARADHAPRAHGHPPQHTATRPSRPWRARSPMHAPPTGCARLANAH